MIAGIRAKFDISDEEALYIKQVTEEKAADPVIRSTVHARREDLVYLCCWTTSSSIGTTTSASSKRDACNHTY